MAQISDYQLPPGKFGTLSKFMNLKKVADDAIRQKRWELQQEALKQQGETQRTRIGSASHLASSGVMNPEQFKQATGMEISPHNYSNSEAPEGMEIVGYRQDSSPIYRKQTISGDKAGLYTLANESIGSIQDVKNMLFPDGTPQSFRRDIAI